MSLSRSQYFEHNYTDDQNVCNVSVCKTQMHHKIIIIIGNYYTALFSGVHILTAFYNILQHFLHWEKKKLKLLPSIFFSQEGNTYIYVIWQLTRRTQEK